MINTQKTNNKWFKLAIVLAISILLCAAGGFLNPYPDPSWFPPLTKPSWALPKILFSAVWAMLYIMMGISFWLVWITPSEYDKQPAVNTFFAFILLNIMTNFLWSGLLFYADTPLLDAGNTAFLLVIALLTISLFWQHSKPAAYLLFPYILWIFVAAGVNMSLWMTGNQTT